MTCPKLEGPNYLAQELAREQTLENLYKFSDRLFLADQFRKAKGKRREIIRKKFMQAQLEAKGLTVG